MSLKHPRAKGNLVRQKAIEYLKSQGYDVAITERTGRFLKEKDAFGVGDLLAIIPDNMPILVQVSTNHAHPSPKYREFAKRYGEHIALIQMVWIDRKGFKIYRYMPNGEIL